MTIPKKMQVLLFSGERQITVKEVPCPHPAAGEVLVAAETSAISAGSELLIYRNQMPESEMADSAIQSLQHALQYPLRYGYCMVGRVIATGKGVAEDWAGKRVFSFEPHGSHFVSAVTALQVVPEDITAEAGVFLANMETAVNFILDGRPLLGEKVVVLGQGIVGLLTSGLLAAHPLSELLVFDRYAPRRTAGLAAGATAAFDPDTAEEQAAAHNRLQKGNYAGADLVYELTGMPEALNLAIELAGFHSRVVVGSWYGRRQAALDLGGNFHRQRIRLVSSQVSTLTPELSGRWNKARRFETAWEGIRSQRPERFITHRYRLEDAAAAYALLDVQPEVALQAVFHYS